MDNLEKQDMDALKGVAQLLARQAIWPPPPADPQTPDFALARFVVWPAAGPNPEIGLGRQQAIWAPGQGYRLGEWMGPAAGPVVAAAWPAPTFLLLSSAEQRRILTQVASHRDPPTGKGWTPLIPQQIVIRTRDTIPWMRPPAKVEPQPK
jgi:hypothetical protein